MISENKHEPEKRRLGASFWANQIATGFIVFRQVKRVFKTKKEKVSHMYFCIFFCLCKTRNVYFW